MRRYKSYEPDQVVFLSFSGRDQFPAESFERFIVDVFNTMDLEYLVPDQPDKGGEAPYDPRGVFGSIFYGFARGVFSSRKLEAACRTDVGFMYVSGFCCPDHTTFSRYICEHGGEIRTLFARILYLADQKGYVDYRMIATDGTKIHASASHKFTGTIEEFNKKRQRLEQKIELAMEKLKKCSASEETAYWNAKVDRYRAEKERIEVFLKDAQKIETKKGKEIRQNITDPDCRLMKIGAAIGEGYNAQASCSGKNGIMIAAAVGNNVDDKENLFKMHDLVYESVPEHARRKLACARYLFDSGYYSTENVLESLGKGINVYIPEKQDAKYYGERKKRPKTSIGIEDCTIRFGKRGVAVTCPGGRTFTKWKIKVNNGKRCYRFPVLSPSKCGGCSVHSVCIGKQVKNWKDFTILTSKLDQRKVLSEYGRKMHSEKGKRIYANRMPLIERTFGYLKEDIGFRHFLRRGLQKVSNEWLIVCGAYNLTRMFHLTYS